MSYADMAAKGPKQTDEEKYAFIILLPKVAHPY